MKQPISIVRGTTNAFGISVVDEDGNPVTLKEDEVLVFAVKENPTDQSRLFTKKITNVAEGDYYLELTPEDTLYIDSGRYFYDVGLQKGTTIFYNVVEASLFEIRPNITELGDGS